MRHHPVNDAAWSFETPQFFIGLYAEPEDLDPADCFQFDDDIEAVRSGAVEWFQAAVKVYWKAGHDEPRDWHQVGADYLGGCAYESVREFFTGHHIYKAGDYFTDMVSVAVAEARKHMRASTAVRMRA